MTKRTNTSLRGKIHVKHGFPFKGEHFKSSGTYVVLTPGNFYEEGGFKRNAAKDKCYSEPFPEEYLLNKGDIVVAMTEQTNGLLGSMAKIPEVGRFLHNQRLGLVTALTDDIDIEYLCHAFKTKSVRQQIRRSASGSKVKHTSPERIYDIELPLPSVLEQRQIAKLLSTIDEKMEINDCINQELEGMAKLLYDYWFVQFDFPMTAAQAAATGKPRLEGKPYRTSGGKMIFSEDCKRDIPENWHGKTLQDILTLQYGKALKKENQISGNFPVYGSGGIYGYHNVPLVAGPGIVVGRKGSVGEVHWSNDSFFPTDTSYYVEPKPGIDLNYIYFLLQNLPLKSMNSDSAVPGLSREATYRLPAILPDLSVIADFARFAVPLRAAMGTNEKENQELTELRDWLLPMLMNGQISFG